jgi:hypothetical protein
LLASFALTPNLTENTMNINFLTAMIMFGCAVLTGINGNYPALMANIVATILAIGFGCEQIKNSNAR